MTFDEMLTLTDYKIHSFVIVEIDETWKSILNISYRCQFHQHFKLAFCTKKLQSQNITREKLREALLYKKFTRKMLIKLTTGENSI